MTARTVRWIAVALVVLGAGGQPCVHDERRRVRAAVLDAVPNGDEAPPASQAAPVLAKAVAVAEHEAAAFGRLDAPKAERADLDAVHAAFVTAARSGQKAAELAAAGDQDYLTALATTNDDARRAGELAVKLGFDRCRPQ